MGRESTGVSESRGKIKRKNYSSTNIYFQISILLTLFASSLSEVVQDDKSVEKTVISSLTFNDVFDNNFSFDERKSRIKRNAKDLLTTTAKGEREKVLSFKSVNSYFTIKQTYSLYLITCFVFITFIRGSCMALQ